MKRILRHYVIDTFSLWIVSNVSYGIIFENHIQTLLIAGAAVTVVSLLAKPIINMLLLPLNLITFGFFRWVSSAIVLYLATLVVKEFKIAFFTYPGFVSKWIEIPALNFKGFLSFIAFAFILSTITSFIYWLIK